MALSQSNNVLTMISKVRAPIPHSNSNANSQTHTTRLSVLSYTLCIFKLYTQHVLEQRTKRVTHICYQNIPDTRFSHFFEAPGYFSLVLSGKVNPAAKTAKFKNDFNYDIVMQQPLENATVIRTRCVDKQGIYILRPRQNDRLLSTKTYE